MKNIHLICNAHIDPVWQWTFDEGISSAIATFKSAVDLAKNFDYIFCHGESILYETIEENVPELFKSIQELVKEGKWKITGGWYIQPDCNIPQGESFYRQIEIGKKYFKNKFGVEPLIATNYDSFGHSVGLVQILAKNGYIGYLRNRPYRYQFNYPDSKFYKWIGPDGSSIISSDTLGYGSPLGKAVEKIEKELPDCEDVDYILWGVGNHGGGPSRKDLQDIDNLRIEGVSLKHSSPENLFKDNISVKNEIKTSLVPSMPGCYSSMAKIKQMHREAENLFFATEKIVAVAKMLGCKFNFDNFKTAEKKLLLAQFHDILPGTCVKDGEKQGLSLLSTTKSICEDYRLKAFMFLSINQYKANEGEYPIFVFNYMPYDIETPVEVEFQLADQNWDENYIHIPHLFLEGKEIECQLIKEESTINLDWRKKIVFSARLKALSVTRLSLIVEKIDAKTLNAAVGDIDRNDAITLELYDDTADPWAMSGAELQKLGSNPKEFRLMDANEIKQFCAINNSLDAVHLTENGKVMSVTEKFLTLSKTNAAIEYRKYKNFSFSDIKVTVEFAEKNKLLRLKIPAPQGIPYGDGPYVSEPKGNTEITFQKWCGVQIADDKYFAVINDGIYGGKIENGFVYLTLLRGAGYCIHPTGRPLYPEDRYLPRIDCGRYEFNIRLFNGNIDEVSKQAEIFNQKPYALNIFPIGGQNKTEMPISIDGQVILSALRVEGNGKYMARLFNPSKEAKEVVINYNNKKMQIKMAAFEIKTVLL